jgi:hypothetical protein
MPRHPEWIHHIPAALAALHAIPSPTIDRQTIESLFHVSPRQALRILSKLGCYAAGKSLLIERRDLAAKLEALLAGDSVRIEQSRHERVSQHLERYRKQQQARRIRIPVAPEAAAAHIASLPPGVTLHPGTLHIQFTTAQDLLSKLFTLSQAIANDYASFEEAIG